MNRDSYGKSVRSANRRRRATANFEIVDDRFKEDGVRSGGRLGSNRFSNGDLRDRSSSPVTEKRSSTCPPPLKGTFPNKILPPKLSEPPKANEMENIDSSNQVQVSLFTSCYFPGIIFLLSGIIFSYISQLKSVVF